MNLLPFIAKEEQTRIRQELDGQNMSVIFDGTTHLNEAL